MHRTLVCIASLCAAAACVAADEIQPPNVPAPLQPPAGQSVFLAATATGVQIYKCTRKPDGAFEWALQGPEATLSAADGKEIGKHYAGPTWESTDGSAVVGEVKAKDAGPSPTAVPWLLLSAKSTRGSGVFAATKSIQRVATAGGVAPAKACTEASVDAIERSPYSATYYFYR
ncbi:MAG TPA: DUF3455 domain-containing protein [Rudaea sp.]|nr:DUF3455 domain-containing protein [Rudaea sp.]